MADSAESAKKRTRHAKRSERTHDAQVVRQFFSNDDEGPAMFPAHLIARLKAPAFDDSYNDDVRPPTMENRSPEQLAAIDKLIQTKIEPIIAAGRLRVEEILDETAIKPPARHRHRVMPPPTLEDTGTDSWSAQDPLRLITRGHSVALAHMSSYEAIENVMASYAFNAQPCLPTLSNLVSQMSACRPSAFDTNTCILTLSLDPAKDVFFVALELQPSLLDDDAAAAADDAETVVPWDEVTESILEGVAEVRSHVYFTCGCDFLTPSSRQS